MTISDMENSLEIQEILDFNYLKKKKKNLTSVSRVCVCV
jgi:hypothetical protein